MDTDNLTKSAGPRPSAVPRREPKTAQIARHLLDYLLSGDLTPGQRIPSERQLAEALHVGRSGAREALKSLALLGLLEVRQGNGTYLASSSSSLLPQVVDWGLLLGEPRIRDLMEARTHIEMAVAGLAAERADSPAIRELESIAARMEAECDSVEANVEADVAFHMAIAQASGNEILVSLLHSIRSLLQAWAKRILESGVEDMQASLKLHTDILAAIKLGSASAAREAMAVHMDSANELLRRALLSQT